MPDDRRVASTGARLSPEEVARRGFVNVWRGFDAQEVKAFLAEVAEEMRAGRERERELQRQVDDAEHRARHPRLERSTLMSALGEETARILQNAEDAADAIVSKAQEEADRIRAESEERAAQLQERAESVLGERTEEAEAAATAIRTAADADADEARRQAQASADATIDEARQRGLVMIEEAQAARERVLHDLARRKRLVQLQVDQLRAGRERLLDAYRLVRSTLDQVTAELEVVEQEAHQAADAVAQRMADGVPEAPSADSGELAVPTDFAAALAPAPEPAAELPEPDLEPGEVPPPEPEPDPMPDPLPASNGASTGDELAVDDGPGSVRILRRPKRHDDPLPEAELTAVDAPDEQEGVRVLGPVAKAAPEAEPEPGPELLPDPAAEPVAEAPAAPEPDFEPDFEPEPELVIRADPVTPLAMASISAATPVIEPEVVSQLDTAPVAEEPDPHSAAEAAPGAEAVAGPETVDAQPEPEGVADAPPEPEPVAEAPLAPELEPVPDSEPAAGRPELDDLFARIRADRADAVARAEEVLAEAQAQPATEPDQQAAPEPAAVEVVAEAVGGDADGATEDEGAEEAPVPDADELVLQQRDGALDPIESRLARRLKRALADEQNEVLDRLRSRRGKAPAQVALPSADEQAGRYAAVASPFLAEAAKAGASFADSGRPPDADAPVDVEALVDELTAAITGALRPRLERGLGDAGGDEVAAADAVNAAYREWKGRRVEQLAADHAVAAFDAAAFAVVADGEVLRWVVDDGRPCPDCDDNALAGPTPKGEEYPTGQRHPPAHAGCRCVLVPAGDGGDGGDGTDAP